MRVLVTGAYGFIGSHVVAALLRAGHEPIAAVRTERVGRALPGVPAIGCDFSSDIDVATWRSRLDGMDAVVNCAGILREVGAATFRRVHVEVPLALAGACHDAAVRRLVQLSALGHPDDGGFVASKHEGDEKLLACGLDVVVLRPSVVCSPQASYGGTTLLRGLAALAWIPLPGRGEQRLQPLDVDDLAQAVVAALSRDEAIGHCLELGGPEAMTLRRYLALWRRWLGLGDARFIRVPKRVAFCGAWLGERFGRGPLGLTMWRMLERGNVVAPASSDHARALLDWSPRPLEAALSQAPASSADRLQARSVFLQPALRFVLAATFVASGVVGLSLPGEQVAALFVRSTLPIDWAPMLSLFGSIADIALGLWLLSGRRPRAALAAMALLVLGYSVFIGVWLPDAWLDPFGGLLKNGVILVAIALAGTAAERH